VTSTFTFIDAAHRGVILGKVQNNFNRIRLGNPYGRFHPQISAIRFRRIELIVSFEIKPKRTDDRRTLVGAPLRIKHVGSGASSSDLHSPILPECDILQLPRKF
jgi:hypothetical protein